MIKHAALKVAAFGAAILASGWAYARYSHGHNASGPKPVTPQGNTVTPTGVVVPPLTPPELPPPGSPPSDLENSAQAAADAVGGFGWQSSQASSSVTDFQNAWNNGGGSPSLAVDGKWGPITSNAAKQAGVVNPPGPYFTPGSAPGTPGDVVSNILASQGDDPSTAGEIGSIVDVIGSLAG